MKKKIFKKNFLTIIRNSIGTNMFRNFYYKDRGDVLKNGDLSCAFYVLTILLIFGFVDRVYFRVIDLVATIEGGGWYETESKRLRKGCIVVWNPVNQGGNGHFHIGFYMGNGIAISNRSSLGVPGEHPVIYSGLDKDQKTKKVTIHAIYWHKKLG
ncbi:MAG: hypothetical protein ACK4FA_02185 [Candidatus Paceibacteria bacterium]